MIVFTIIGIIAVALIAIVFIWEFVVGGSELKDRFMHYIETPFTEEGGTFKITIRDYRMDEFVEATLYEFKKKYKWSRKETWVMMTGGASHYANDSVESWVYGWLESHPDAKVENTCKTYLLPTPLQRAEKERKEAVEFVEKMIRNSKNLVEINLAYLNLLENEKQLSEDNVNMIKKRIEANNDREIKRQDTLDKWAIKIIELNKQIETLTSTTTQLA